MDAVERFTGLVTGQEPDLDVAALVIAAALDPDVDEARWLAELDRLAEGVDSLDGLVRKLFVEEGFAGNTRRYYDPRNSLLHQVLARRLGIPITLSVVCMEVGRRAGVALEGIGMPGHFLVRSVGTQRYLDAFGGALLGRAGCEALFRASTQASPDVPFGPHVLPVVGAGAILTRILTNLRVVYRGSMRPAELERVMWMLLALPGAGVAELVELGNVMGQQGRWLEGARFLEAQAAQRPRDGELLGYAARALAARLN